MSWESDVTAASSLLGAASKFSSANATSSAAQQEAGYQETNIANNTLRKVGTLQTSFLQSGIALDPDTAVSSVMQQAISQGVTDINRTQTNANTASSNANTAARAAALSGLGDTALKLFGVGSGSKDGSGSGSSWLGSFLSTGDTNALGQSIGGALDPSPVGPYQSPF